MSNKRKERKGGGEGGREERAEEKGREGRKDRGGERKGGKGVGGENKERVMQDRPLSQTATIFMRAAVPVCQRSSLLGLLVGIQ